MSNGKLILVVGPSFGGKTFLVQNIINQFDHVEVVNYELFYRKSKRVDVCYTEFSDHIRQKLKDNQTVIAESTGHWLLETGKMKDVPAFLVVAFPSMERHMKNYNQYLKAFGMQSTVRRSGGHGVMEMRKSFTSSLAVNNGNLPTHSTVFNGGNINETITGIKKYLDGISLQSLDLPQLLQLMKG